jgi:DNA-binding beta-propeller fold protein YncE
VLEIDAKTGGIEHTIEVGSDKAHRIEVTPDGSKLYSENEEDTFSSVIDLKARKRINKIPAPNGLAGLGMSPDGKTIVLIDAKKPQIMVVDTATDKVTRTVQLDGHEKAAQIARYSPDGKYLIVTSHDAPLATIFDAKLETRTLLQLGKGPMNMAFHPNGRTLLIANHDAGSLAVIDLERAEVLRTVPAGVGVETLSFY